MQNSDNINLIIMFAKYSIYFLRSKQTVHPRFSRGVILAIKKYIYKRVNICTCTISKTIYDVPNLHFSLNSHNTYTYLCLQFSVHAFLLYILNY